MDGRYESCLSTDHVDAWDIVQIKYSGPPVTCDDCVPSAAAGPETEMTGSSSSESELLSDNDTDVEMPEQFNSEGESPVASASESDWSDDNLDNDQDQDQSEGERMAFFQAARAELAQVSVMCRISATS